jgi:hypothetical protein
MVCLSLLCGLFYASGQDSHRIVTRLKEKIKSLVAKNRFFSIKGIEKTMVFYVGDENMQSEIEF